VRSKVVRKKKVDTEDADIVKYKEIYEYIEELVESDKTVQKIDIEIEPDLARKEELRELVDRYQTGSSIPREKFAAPIVPTTAPAQATIRDNQMDLLTKSLEKLSINMATIV
jgi:hypothetical protein